jgi:hypothetical protein
MDFIEEKELEKRPAYYDSITDQPVVGLLQSKTSSFKNYASLVEVNSVEVVIPAATLPGGILTPGTISFTFQHGIDVRYYIPIIEFYDTTGELSEEFGFANVSPISYDKTNYYVNGSNSNLSDVTFDLKIYIYQLNIGKNVLENF